jgi:polar amino acid transport system substrate-binding protein
MMSSMWRTLACGLAIMGAMMVSGCGCSSSDPAEDSLTRIKREGVLRIGYANEAPFAYLDEGSGEVTGEAPEIAKKIASKLGVKKVEGVLTEFGALIPGLKAGRFDVIAAGMYIRPERAEQVLFTAPTYGLGEGFLVAEGNPLKLNSYQDVVDNAEVRFGAVAGTAELAYADALGIDKDRVVVFPDNTAALAGLVADRVDAVGLTALTCADLVSKKGDRKIERAEPFTDPDIDGKQVRSYGAFAVRMGDETLRDAFNAELKSFLGTPEHTALVKPFGFGPSESAKGKTLADVLAGFGSK